MRKRAGLIAFVLAFLVAVLAGRWGKALFTTSEFVHFSVNFPTQVGFEQMPVDVLGGPWFFLEPEEWQGYPPGGILVWGTEGKISVDLGRQGWIKDLIQPRVVLLSTHWMRNVGTQPYTLALDLEMCGFETKWLTFERHWDPSSKVLERSIKPKEFASMDWEIVVPDGRFDDGLVCDGVLSVRDVDSGELLTRLPIELVNTSVGDRQP